jgi:hypothetical protein
VYAARRRQPGATPFRFAAACGHCYAPLPRRARDAGQTRHLVRHARRARTPARHAASLRVTNAPGRDLRARNVVVPCPSASWPDRWIAEGPLASATTVDDSESTEEAPGRGTLPRPNPALRQRRIFRPDSVSLRVSVGSASSTAAAPAPAPPYALMPPGANGVDSSYTFNAPSTEPVAPPTHAPPQPSSLGLRLCSDGGDLGRSVLAPLPPTCASTGTDTTWLRSKLLLRNFFHGLSELGALLSPGRQHSAALNGLLAGPPRIELAPTHQRRGHTAAAASARARAAQCARARGQQRTEPVCGPAWQPGHAPAPAHLPPPRARIHAPDPLRNRRVPHRTITSTHRRVRAYWAGRGSTSDVYDGRGGARRSSDDGHASRAAGSLGLELDRPFPGETDDETDDEYGELLAPRVGTRWRPPVARRTRSACPCRRSCRLTAAAAAGS